MKLTVLGAFLAVLIGCRQPSGDPVAQTAARDDALPSCEWCGATEAPKELSWHTRIAASKEAGEPLAISGTVYAPDGATPASDVVLYLYHIMLKAFIRSAATRQVTGADMAI
jgi:protocatechuate 3,4-dioxygenase beta subunit